MVGIERPICGFEGLVNSSLAQLIILLFSKAQHLQLFNRLQPINPPQPVNPLLPFNLLMVAKPLVPNVHGPQLEEHLVRLLFILVKYIFLHIIFKTPSPELHQLVTATNFLR